MKSFSSISVRRAVISAATAIAISLPGIGSAGLLDRIKSRVQVVKTNVSNPAVHVQENRPLPRAHSGFSVMMVPSKKVEQHKLFLSYTINMK
jgi:hypothetical protein